MTVCIRNNRNDVTFWLNIFKFFVLKMPCAKLRKYKKKFY